MFLNCTFHSLTHPPAFIFWYKDDKMVNHEFDVRISPTHSTLRLRSVQGSKMPANFTCSPENALPASVTVHVLSDEYNSAAAAIDINNNKLDALAPSSSSSLLTSQIGVVVIIFLVSTIS